MIWVMDGARRRRRGGLPVIRVKSTARRGGRRLTGAPALLLAAALGACVPAEVPADPEVPQGRQADGLLEDEELQAVVDAQVRRAWEPLSELLGHERAAVRARAAFALASVQAPEAVPALLESLEDPDPSVRRDVAFALGQSALVEAGPHLLGALAREEEATVRHRLLEALGKLPSREVLNGLLELDAAGGERVHRLAAIGRLGGVHGLVTEDAKDVLVAELASPDGAARHAAAYLFGRQRNTVLWADRAEALRRALDGYRVGDPAAIHLTRALARLGDPADEERLARLATSAPDWRVRAEAMLGLGGAGRGDEARNALLAGLNDGSIHVAVNAANTLGAGEPSPATLERMATWVRHNSETWQVAGPLLAGLARQGEEELVLTWVRSTGSTDVDRQVVGFRALGLLPGEEALRHLQIGARSASDRVAAAAMTGLRQRWGEAAADPELHAAYFEIFSNALASGRAAVASVAAPLLADPTFARFGNTEVLLDALDGAEMPDDLRFAQIVLSSLGQTGDAAVADVLRQALQHPYADMRRTAAGALGRHFGEEIDAPEGGVEAPQANEDGAQRPDPSRIDWAYLATLGPSPLFVLETEAGELVVRMSSEEAPHTVQTMARLAQEGRFDGTPFHRVVPNFVIQGGDVGSGDGRGGPGFAITTESTLIPYQRGVIGMASAGKDTEGSQFFLVHSAQPHLDGGYTAFGWLVSGHAALDAVKQGDLLLSARVEPGG